MSSSHDFPKVYKKLGVDLSALGCVMLPVAPMRVTELDGLKPEHLYVTKDPKKFWIKGDVASKGGHITLLYGLLEHATDWADLIDEVLKGWRAPNTAQIHRYEAFQSPYEDEPYSCIVAKVFPERWLKDAHSRLSHLPHIDTFPGYEPHITVAYVHKQYESLWLRTLNHTEPTHEWPIVDGPLDLGRKH